MKLLGQIVPTADGGLSEFLAIEEIVFDIVR
jgi:hypothetical protein